MLLVAIYLAYSPASAALFMPWEQRTQLPVMGLAVGRTNILDYLLAVYAPSGRNCVSISCSRLWTIRERNGKDAIASVVMGVHC